MMRQLAKVQPEASAYPPFADRSVGFTHASTPPSSTTCCHTLLSLLQANIEKIRSEPFPGGIKTRNRSRKAPTSRGPRPVSPSEPPACTHACIERCRSDLPLQRAHRHTRSPSLRTWPMRTAPPFPQPGRRAPQRPVDSDSASALDDTDSEREGAPVLDDFAVASGAEGGDRVSRPRIRKQTRQSRKKVQARARGVDTWCCTEEYCVRCFGADFRPAEEGEVVCCEVACSNPDAGIELLLRTFLLMSTQPYPHPWWLASWVSRHC